jgi:hypothetical protein
MNERRTPDEMAPFEAEVAGIDRRIERRIDPGAAAMPVAVAVLVLAAAFLLPWTGSTAGWEVLVGEEY